MKPYNINAKCTKCGCESVTTDYKDGLRPFEYIGTEDTRLLRIKEEHLSRRCVNCGFAWPESVVEYEEAFTYKQLRWYADELEDKLSQYHKMFFGEGAESLLDETISVLRNYLSWKLENPE